MRYSLSTFDGSKSFLGWIGERPRANRSAFVSRASFGFGGWLASTSMASRGATSRTRQRIDVKKRMENAEKTTKQRLGYKATRGTGDHPFCGEAASQATFVQAKHSCRTPGTKPTMNKIGEDRTKWGVTGLFFGLWGRSQEGYRTL